MYNTRTSRESHTVLMTHGCCVFAERFTGGRCVWAEISHFARRLCPETSFFRTSSTCERTINLISMTTICSKVPVMENLVDMTGNTYYRWFRVVSERSVEMREYSMNHWRSAWTEVWLIWNFGELRILDLIEIIIKLKSGRITCYQKRTPSTHSACNRCPECAPPY